MKPLFNLLFLFIILNTEVNTFSKSLKTDIVDINKNPKRNLEESSNFVTLTFNQDFSFKILSDSKFKDDIDYILNKKDSKKIGSTETINAYKNSDIEIHFKKPLEDCIDFFTYINAEIKDKIIYVDLSNLDTTNLKYINYMFDGCTSLKSINFSGFDTSQISEMEGLFKNCYSLEEIDLSNFVTSKVTTMNEIFQNCIALKSLNLSSFDTSKVINMGSMFENCSSLIDLDISHFNTINVETMDEMFSSCSSLKALDLSHFLTSNVNSMAYMFSDCFLLTSINLINFNTSNVDSMEGMFSDCSSLITINLSSFDTSSVSYSMASMFSGCSSLIYLNLSNFHTSLVNNMAFMFHNCSCLKVLDISNFNTTSGLAELNRQDPNNKDTPSSLPAIYTDIFLNSNKMKYINLYNTIDTGLISNSSLNNINDLIVCQKNIIITNPTAQNKCFEYDFDIDKDTCNESEFLSFSTDFNEISENSILSSDFSPFISDSIYNSIDNTNLNNEEIIYTINSRVFLLGYTSFNILNSNIFFFYIYFITLKNTIYSSKLTFPISIKYENNLRILQTNEEANCEKIEMNSESKIKYFCSVKAKTSDKDDIELSTDFIFKPQINFNSFYISSLAKMNLNNFTNIENKEYSAQNILILDNSRIIFNNKTLFEIQGLIDEDHSNIEESPQLLIENILSETEKFKKLDCIISNNSSNNYNLMCIINEKAKIFLQGSVAFVGDYLLLINFENDGIIFDNSGENDSGKSRFYFKINSSNKSWIIAVVIVIIVVFLILITIIIYLLKNRNLTEPSSNNSTKMFIKKL